jgi:hypothetical protein
LRQERQEAKVAKKTMAWNYLFSLLVPTWRSWHLGVLGAMFSILPLKPTPEDLLLFRLVQSRGRDGV